MNPDDIKKTPKLFCESVNVVFTKEFFAMNLSSGVSSTSYAFTPEHMKRLSQYLAHQVADFEKENGEIKTSWSPTIISPLQPKKPPTSLS